MINGKKIVVVMPAYNAEKTLEQTYREIPFDTVDEVILVDDFSQDLTVEKARELGIKEVIKMIAIGGMEAIKRVVIIGLLR